MIRFAFNEEQEELRRQARAFLDRNSASDRVRAAMQIERGYEEDLWRRIGGELGWTAITIPEVYGGLGLGYVELVALFEETGRALLCSPLFSTIALAANALLAAGESERAAELLPGIAAGETTAPQAATATAPEVIYGAELMTQAERDAYLKKLGAAKTDAEKANIRQKHHDEIAALAKKKGITIAEPATAQPTMTTP